jgi:hypothetical protein
LVFAVTIVIPQLHQANENGMLAVAIAAVCSPEGGQTNVIRIGSPPIVPKSPAPSRPSQPKISAAEQSAACASRLPPDWQPSDEGMGFATEILGYQQARVECERFRDYWLAKAGAGAMNVDWSATWRNWVRKSAEQRGLSPELPQPKRVTP